MFSTGVLAVPFVFPHYNAYVSVAWTYIYSVVCFGTCSGSLALTTAIMTDLPLAAVTVPVVPVTGAAEKRFSKIKITIVHA